MKSFLYLLLFSSVVSAPLVNAKQPAPKKTFEKKLKKATVTRVKTTATSKKQPLNKNSYDQIKKLLQESILTLDQNNLDKAIILTKKSLKKMRASASLKISKLKVIHGSVKGLGDYYPAQDGILTNRLLHLYVEVENFTWKERQHSNGQVFNAELQVIGLFLEEDGREIGTKPLGKRKFKTRTLHDKTYFGLEIKLSPRIPAGRYQIELQINDLKGRKSATKRVLFEVR